MENAPTRCAWMARAIPKSSSLTRSLPSSSWDRNTFAGLRSRWRTPSACACSSAWATCVTIFDIVASGTRWSRTSTASSVSPFEELHDEVGEPVLLAVIGHADDVAGLAREARGDLGLELEARRRRRCALELVALRGLRQELERQLFPERPVVRRPHLAHGTRGRGGARARTSRLRHDRRRSPCRPLMVAPAGGFRATLRRWRWVRVHDARSGRDVRPLGRTTPRPSPPSSARRCGALDSPAGGRRRELAEAAGFSSNYIARLERGELGPSFFVASQLCSTLGIAVGSLTQPATTPAKTTRRRIAG